MKATGIDYAIILVYLLGCFAAGVLGKRYAGSLSHYLVAGRGLGLHLGIATLAATETGIVTYMYFGELGYVVGFSAMVIGLLTAAVTLLIGYTGFAVKPLRELRLMTVPEYFERRYSRGVRILMGFFVALGGILNMGVFLRIEGTFLVHILGFPPGSLTVVMTVLLTIVIVYTFAGGMVAVVITDFIQFAILGFGAIVITGLAFQATGLGELYETARTVHGSAPFNPLSHPQLGWSFLLWQGIQFVAVMICWQPVAMRAFSMKDSETTRRMFSWTSLFFLGRATLPIFWGIAALAFLADPSIPGLQAVPEFLDRLLGPGLRGVVIASMLAASMSTNSAYLISWSSVICQDIIVPLSRKSVSEKRQLVLNRVLVVVVGLALLFWGLWYTLPGPAYFYLEITGTIYLSGALAAILGGIYWKKANKVGAYSAVLSGALGALSFFFLDVPANYAGFASFGLTFIAMWAGSLIGCRLREDPALERTGDVTR